MRPSARASGTTLIELIVVLAIIAILFGVALPAVTRAPDRPDAFRTEDSLRWQAIRSGTVVRRTRGDSGAVVVALPDGRVIGAGGTDAR